MSQESIFYPVAAAALWVRPVPKGAEHAPMAEEETHMLLIEPTGTPNSGDPKTAAPRRVI